MISVCCISFHMYLATSVESLFYFAKTNFLHVISDAVTGFVSLVQFLVDNCEHGVFVLVGVLN